MDTKVCDDYIGDKICDVVYWQWDPVHRRSELVMSLEACGPVWDFWSVVIGCVVAGVLILTCVCAAVGKTGYQRVRTR